MGVNKLLHLWRCHIFHIKKIPVVTENDFHHAIKQIGELLPYFVFFLLAPSDKVKRFALKQCCIPLVQPHIVSGA